MRHPLAARRVLVIAPHPDDEAIGAGGLLQAMARRGAHVRVVVVSDGAASHPGSRTWPPARLIGERRRETLRAMGRLAIAPARIRFLGLPDGALASCRCLDAALGRAVRQGPRPDLIVAPVPDDAHSDHRAVARALARVPRRGERRIGYRVWPLGAGRRGPALGLALDGAALRRKRQLIRSYRTQAGRITDAEAGCTLTPRHLRAFAAPTERFEVLR